MSMGYTAWLVWGIGIFAVGLLGSWLVWRFAPRRHVASKRRTPGEDKAVEPPAVPRAEEEDEAEVEDARATVESVTRAHVENPPAESCGPLRPEPTWYTWTGQRVVAPAAERGDAPAAEPRRYIRVEDH